MTSPFKSTLSVAARRRQRPVVERSSFVVASIGDVRVALPVEQVDRVVRPAGGHVGDAPTGAVMHQRRQVPVHGLAGLLGQSESPATAATRILLVQAAERGACLAVRVDQVHEVCAVDTSLVQPVDARGDGPIVHAAVRGRFRQAEAAVWVVDTTRLPNVS